MGIFLFMTPVKIWTMAFYMHGESPIPHFTSPHLRGWCFRTVVGWDNPAVAPAEEIILKQLLRASRWAPTSYTPEN